MERVTTFNLADNYIERLADYIEDSYIRKGKDIAGLAIVFGGKRPSLFLKKELSRRIGRSFISPRFFSIDEFVEYVIAKKESVRRLSDLDSCFMIYTLAKRLAPEILKTREHFAQFLPWAREILAFIEQLDLEDIKASALHSIQHKAEIGYDVPENINALLKSIVSIREAFHVRLRDARASSRGVAYLTASRCIGISEFGEFDQILFCGFFYLHATESAIIKTLYDAGKASLILQGDARDWSVLEKLAKDFSCPIQPEKAATPAFSLSISAGFDAHSQACLVRERLKGITNTSSALIVLPDAESLIPLLSEIAGVAGEFNVSMGYPLKRSSLYSLFDSIREAQGTRSGQAYYTKDYLKCLGHPLVKNLKVFADAGITRVLVHKIEEILVGIEETQLGGSVFVTLDNIEHTKDVYDLTLATIKSMGYEVSYDDLKKAVETLHALLFTAWEGMHDFNDFSLSLEKLLSTLIRQSPLGVYPLNIKMAEKTLAIIDELKAAAFNKEEFPGEDIFRIFENKLENEMISFAGSPLKGLQILGVFETRSLHFEDIIIMDVNESILPSLKIYEPLIPREVMISLGLNRLEKEEEIQRYQFKRLISSAKHVELIYQDGPKRERSRFIEELIWEREKQEKKLGVFSIPRAAFRVKVLPKKLQVKKTSGVVAFLKKREYSASSINMYLHCPLRFYYRYVLNLEEKEDLRDEPEARDVGTFVHELLEEEFRQFLNRTPRIDARFRETFLEAFEKKFNDQFSRKMKSDAFLTKEVLRFSMERFLEDERARDVQKIICLEKTFSGTRGFGIGDFSCKAIVDRIEQASDGSILIVDYKTGGTDILPETDTAKLEAQGFTRVALKRTVKSFQLPLYLYLVALDSRFRATSSNACLYFIKDVGKDRRVKKLFKDGFQPADKDRLMHLYLLGLEAVYKDILDPGVPFAADEEDARQCGTCPYFYLCR